MDERVRESIISRVTECLETEGRGIDTETYEQLFRSISEALEDVAEYSDQYSSLKRLTYAQRNYGRAEELEGFDIGACWGSMKVLEAVERRSKAFEDEQRCRTVVSNHPELFEFIERNPDITHGELAVLLETTPSNPSQMLSRILPLRLIAVTISGRNKRYILTPYAKRIVAKRNAEQLSQYDKNSATSFEMDIIPMPVDRSSSAKRAQGRADNSSPKKSHVRLKVHDGKKLEPTNSTSMRFSGMSSNKTIDNTRKRYA